MPSLADVLGNTKNPHTLTAGRFTVATTGPLTVYIDGGTEAVPGFEVAGCAYTVGASGLYWHIQGQDPVCYQRA